MEPCDFGAAVSSSASLRRVGDIWKDTKSPESKLIRVGLKGYLAVMEAGDGTFPMQNIDTAALISSCLSFAQWNYFQKF